VYRFLPSLSSGDANDVCQWEVQALSVGFRAGAHRRCRVAEEGFHLWGNMNTLVTSSCTLPQMFYVLEHFPLLYLVISKQSCNNLIPTLIMIMYALHVCLCILASSRITGSILR
jgi:hypothetical protein